jgi:hypothetical protein
MFQHILESKVYAVFSAHLNPLFVRLKRYYRYPKSVETIGLINFGILLQMVPLFYFDFHKKRRGEGLSEWAGVGGVGGGQLLCLCEKLIVFYIHTELPIFSNLTYTFCSERSGGLSNDTSSFNFHRMSEIPDTLYMVSSQHQTKDDGKNFKLFVVAGVGCTFHTKAACHAQRRKT